MFWAGFAPVAMEHLADRRILQSRCRGPREDRGAIEPSKGVVRCPRLIRAGETRERVEHLRREQPGASQRAVFREPLLRSISQR